MLRSALSKRLICAAFFPFSSVSNQVPDDKQLKISPSRIYLDKFKKIMWNENGYPTKELQSVINTTATGIVTGFICGGLISGRSIAESFKKENQATLFNSTFEAQKQIHIKANAAFIKGGLRFATKLGMFCFILSSTSMGIHIYRGKFDILNHIYGGALTGFLFKINMGVKGAFSGTLLGTILGTISGLFTLSILWITGYNIDNIYDVNTKIANARRDKIKANSKSYLNEEENKIREMNIENQHLNAAYMQQRKE